jgi:hypothetical protein
MKECVHIGEMIKQKVKECGIKISDFANAIHCDRTNVYSIFKRKNIDILQLHLISQVLNYDFISEVCFKNDVQKKYLIIIEVDEQRLQEFLSDASIKFIKHL